MSNISVRTGDIMTEKIDSMEQLKEFLSSQDKLMVIANALYGSKGPIQYKVVEIKISSEGEIKKRSSCTKGRHISEWFCVKKNWDSCKLPSVLEEDMEKAIAMIMTGLMDKKLMHSARKPDSSKRIITESSDSWSKKLVYSWDYEGPAGMRYLKVALTLAALIAIPTYRIWPAFLQKIVLKLSLGIFIFLLGLELIRFVIFLFCRLFGYSLWIFPDLDRDDKGLLGVFYPLISVEKLDDGRNKYRYAILGVLIAFLSIVLYYPKQTMTTTRLVMNKTTSSIQWMRGEWLSVKLATVEYMKKFIVSKPVIIKKKMNEESSYRPEDDVVYDFDESEIVDEDDLVDLDDLDDVKLDIE